MKRSYLLMLLSAVSVTAFAEEDIKQWITDRNTIAIEDFKNEDPTALPNYPTTSTGNESYRGNVQRMANDASSQATTDEGAELIYGVPNRPEFQDDGWYKDAQNVTANPSDYINTVDSEYTDCEEITSEGDTYTEIQACTESRISTTATCTQGRLLEVDADYLYTCNKERDVTEGSCFVGRKIDVTQSHRYSCEAGEKTRSKKCSDKLHVEVEYDHEKKFVPVLRRCTTGSLQNNKCIQVASWIHLFFPSWLVPTGSTGSIGIYYTKRKFWHLRIIQDGYWWTKDIPVNNKNDVMGKEFTLKGISLLNEPAPFDIIAKVGVYKDKGSHTSPNEYLAYSLYFSNANNISSTDPISYCPVQYPYIEYGNPMPNGKLPINRCYSRVISPEPIITEEWRKTCN